jgi:Spy/CpxP family protein refolding chaperone
MAIENGSPRRVRLLTILVLVATFVLGGFTGAAVGHALRRSGHRPPSPFPMLIRELGLTPEQDAKARAIFDAHAPALEAIAKDTFPRVRAINEAMEQELRAVLTPEQIRKLDELLAHRPPRLPGGRGFPPGFGMPGADRPAGAPPDGPPPVPGEPPPPDRRPPGN